MFIEFKESLIVMGRMGGRLSDGRYVMSFKESK